MPCFFPHMLKIIALTYSIQKNKTIVYDIFLANNLSSYLEKMAWNSLNWRVIDFSLYFMQAIKHLQDF